MKKYQKLFISLSLLTFVACGSSGGGSNLNPTIPSNVDTITIENSHLDKTLNPEKSGKTTIFNGNININDETSIGAIAKEGVHLTNGEKSTITGTMETGMKTLEKASITNNGEISGHIKNGMSANGEDSIATNNHLITLNSNNDTQEADDEGSVDSKKKNITIIGMKALKGASIINGIDGKISGDLTFGIFTSNKKSKAINYGKISSNGTDSIEVDGKYNYIDKLAVGMYAKNSASIINAQGASISGRLTDGMYAEDEGSNAINSGNINSMGSTSDQTYSDTEYTYKVRGTGMDADNGASITNSNGASISGRLAYGMYAYGKGSYATNEGNITSDGYYSIHQDNPINQKLKLKSQDITKEMLNHLGIGMNSEDGASITNAQTGVIQGKINIGMHSSYENSESHNYGTIFINNNNGIGMKSNSSGISINEVGGKIYLNGSNQIGMYAYGKGSTIENDGDIYLSGTIDENFKKSSEETCDIDSEVPIYNGKDSKGNIGMKIGYGAKMINKGTIHFAQSK